MTPQELQLLRDTNRALLRLTLVLRTIVVLLVVAMVGVAAIAAGGVAKANSRVAAAATPSPAPVAGPTARCNSEECYWLATTPHLTFKWGATTTNPYQHYRPRYVGVVANKRIAKVKATSYGVNWAVDHGTWKVAAAKRVAIKFPGDDTWDADDTWRLVIRVEFTDGTEDTYRVYLKHGVRRIAA